MCGLVGARKHSLQRHVAGVSQSHPVRGLFVGDAKLRSYTQLTPTCYIALPITVQWRN